MPLAAGASQPRWSPDRRPPRLHRRRRGRARAAVRALDGDGPGGARSPACPIRRRASPGRPTAARSLMRCSCPTKARGSAPPQPRPEGAQWADPLQVITAVTYRADGQGYLRAGYDQLFLVSSEGGAPRQLSYGPYNNGGPLSWTPDGRTILFSGNRSANWEREGFNTEVYALDVASNRITRADQPQRARRRAGGVARRAAGRLSPAMTTSERGYENAILYVMNADGSNRARADRRARPQRRRAGLGRRTAARSTSNMTITARPRWRGSASTASIRTVAEGLERRRFRPALYRRQLQRRPRRRGRAVAAAARPGRPTSCSSAAARGGS